MCIPCVLRPLVIALLIPNFFHQCLVRFATHSTILIAILWALFLQCCWVAGARRRCSSAVQCSACHTGGADRPGCCALQDEAKDAKLTLGKLEAVAAKLRESQEAAARELVEAQTKARE